MAAATPAHCRISLGFDVGSRRVSARSDTGSVHEASLSPQTEADILDRLVRISPTGLRLCGAHGDPPNASDGQFPARSPRASDVEWLGGMLGSLLFGGEIGRETLGRLHDARQQGQYLCVHIAADDPFLRLLPWETAVLPEGGHPPIPVCWSEDVTIVRCDAPVTTRSLTLAGTLQALMVIDDPGYFETDAWGLRSFVQSSARNVHVAEPLVALSWADVAARLTNRESNWHVLIYAGHVATLEGLSFRGDLVTCDDFVGRAVSTNSDLRCAVLLGCSTWEVVARRFLETGVPAVLGTNFYLPTGLPRIGLEPFLARLAESGRVDDAFQLLKRSLPREHQATPILCTGTENMRLFRIGAPTASLGDYARGLRGKLDRLELLGIGNEGLREDLYRPRKLLEPDAAKKQKPAEDEHQSLSPPKSQRQLLAELLRPASAQKLCITGEAGSGKSTLLDHLAWELARRFLENPGVQPRRIPFRVSLSSWKGEQPETLKDMILASVGQLDASIITEILESGEAVLLLDGLDEVGLTQRTSLIEWIDTQLQEESLRHNSVVLASRPWALTHSALRRFRTNRLALLDLGRRDIEGYIHSYYGDPDQAHRIARQIASAAATLELAKRPLFLMLLCFVGEQGDTTLPATEGQLLETALRQLPERRGLPREASLRLLASLAWISWHGDQTEITEHRAQQSILESMQTDQLVATANWERRDPEFLLDALAGHTGIVSRDGMTYRFTEATYAEYLAGRWLANRPESEIRAVFCEHVWDPRWLRVLVFMVNRIWMENRKLARSLVEWLLAEADHEHDDLWRRLTLLAARLLGQADSPRNDGEHRLTEDVVRRAMEAWRFAVTHQAIWSVERHEFAHQSLAALAPVAGKSVTGPLTAALRDPGIARHAALTLDLIAKDTPPTIAYDRVRDLKIEEACANAAHVSWTFGQDPAQQNLIRSLSDQNRLVRWLAARANGIAGDSASVPELRGLAMGDDEAHREDAIQALADIGSNEAVDALAELLGHEERAVRDAVAKSLAFIGSDHAVDAIKDFLITQESRESLGFAAYGEELAKDMGMFGKGMAAELVEMMRSHGMWRGHAAVEALGNIRTERATSVLAGLATDDNQGKEVRTAAIKALAASATVGAVDALIGLMQKDDALGGEAASALGKTRSRRAIAPLLAILRDKDSSIRGDAIEALGEIGAVEAVDDIVQALDESHETLTVPFAVAMSLVQLLGREHAADRLIGAMQNLGEKGRIVTATFFVHLGNKELVEKIKEEDEEAAASFEAFGAVAPKRAIPGLITALGDDNEKVRGAAAMALGSTAAQEAVDDLAMLFGDTDIEVRMAAAKALGDIGGDKAVDALLHAVDTGDPMSQMNAIDALGRLRYAGAATVIAPFLSHPVQLLRMCAAHALGQIRSPETSEALLKAAKDEEEGVREFVAQALSAVKTPEAAIALIELARDENDDVRIAALDSLAEIGCGDAEDAFIEALENDNPMIRRSGGHGLARVGTARAVPSLMKKLGDREWKVRMASVTALWKIRDESTIEGLVNGLSDELEHIRALAAEGLGEDGSDRAIEALIGCAADEGKLVRLRAAETFAKDPTDRVMPALVKLALDNEDEVSEAAYVGLVQRFGDEGVLEPLLPILSDPASDLQGSAIRLLLKKNAPEPILRKAIATIGGSPSPAWVALDAHCRDRGVTAFADGRLANPNELQLHAEFEPAAALGD